MNKYATLAKKIKNQDLPYLWKIFQSEKVQWKIGRFDTVQNKDYLFTVLWKFAFDSNAQRQLSWESKEVQETYMRNVWRNKESGCPSQRWRYNKQYAKKHQDSLSQLSHEVALATKEIKEWYTKDRTARLKALGNSIVPAVAVEIMRAIKYVDESYEKA